MPAVYKEGDSKGGNSRLAQVRKPEFTKVNEDFRGKRNAESTLLSRPLFVQWRKVHPCTPSRGICGAHVGTGRLRGLLKVES